MIESMAAGTPVIALRRGAAPEVIVDGQTGFLADNEEEMIKAVARIGELSPSSSRGHVEENFSRRIMAEKYLGYYKKMLADAGKRPSDRP